MAPPSTSTGAGEDSPSRPSLAGAADVSAPSSPLTASTGNASGADSEPSLARPVDALSPVLGATPRSAADAPEAALGTDSTDSQPQGSVSSSGVSGDGAHSAANAPEASPAALGASRFSSVRLEAIEDVVTAGTDRTVRQVLESAQSHFLALPRLVVDMNRRPPLRTDYELDQRREAAGPLSDVGDALAPVPRWPAPWEYELTELRDDVASLEARLAASEASLRREVDLRLKAERLCNQASHERNAALENLRHIQLDHADAARQLVAINIALEQSSQAAAALEQRCRRLDKALVDTHKVICHDGEQFKAGISSYAAQLRQLREYLKQSDRQSSASGGASSASASAMPAAFATFLEELGALQLAIPPPAAASRTSEGSGPTPLASSGSLGGAAATSGSSTSLTIDSDTSDDSGPVIPSSLHKGKGKRAAKSSAKLRSAPPPPKKKQRLGRPSVDLKARKAAKQAASVAVSCGGSSQSVPSSLPVVSVPASSAPISGIAASADSDVLSFAAILSGTPVVSRGITPGTEASVPVKIDDDGGSGADGAASEASAAPGGVLSSQGVAQPRRDGRPTRAASTTAGLWSMAAAENEDAPDALVLGLATPSRMPAATQASAASSASVPGPAKSAAAVAAASAAGVASASARRRVANTHTDRSPQLVWWPLRPLGMLRLRVPGQWLQPPVHDAWDSVYGFRACDRYPGSDPRPAASGTGVTAAPRLGKPSLLPTGRTHCTHGRDFGLASQSLPAPSVRTTLCPTSRFRFGLSVAVVEQWPQQLSDRIGSDTPEYLETEATWRAYNKARNLCADRLRLQIPKRSWVWCTPDASGKIKCPPEILLETSMLQYSFETLTWAPITAAWTAEVVDLDARQPWRNCWVGLPAEPPFNTTFAPCNPSVPFFIPEGSTREEVGVAIVGNPALRPSHVTAPWVQELSDAQAQAAAMPLQLLTRRPTPQVLGLRSQRPTKRASKPSLGPLPLLRLDLTSWLISQRRLKFRFPSVILLILH
ncbi:unnamed protein product [Phytophthora fragariaefolia]|uniref:Unnamed protein product n=1 Tax=Phytophthora fragariaefolia TaxID=1490495 RepID=A0A9W6XSU5_9STRA|nr:unnamed protein product [Phytophthora fragariaefolia]